ncbi:MAG: hypothetical protein ACRC5M_04385 [Anaeroplasmataceae bacterium]
MEKMIKSEDLLKDILNREMWRNDTINSIINSTICEYDIKGAHLMAIRILFDESLYNKLDKMDKLDRNIYIGKMIKKDPTLSKKIQDLLFKFKHKFIIENDIQLSNIIETTKDSFVLAQKIPSKTTVKISGVEVEFRNKDCTYTSFYRLGSKSVLYDSLTGNIRIKGINNNTVQDSPFINLYYKNLLNTLETNTSVGNIECLVILKRMRQKYINASDANIYRSLDNKNKFIYELNGEFIETDIEVPNGNLVRILNYKDFVMPLMRCVI